MAPSNRRPGFSRRAQYSFFIGYVIAAAGALVAVVLLALSSFNPAAFQAVSTGVAEVTTPLSSGLAAVGRTLATVPTAIAEHWDAVAQNRALRSTLARQHTMMMQARTLSYENRRLRLLLKVRDGSYEPVATARLVNSSASSTRRFATLNAGSWQGIRTGQPVRGPDGLIGRTVAVSPNTSRVMLLSDPDSIVPVRRTRDGLAAIVIGRGDGWVDLKSASASAVVFRQGDVFVTSGNGGLFPPNIPVARTVAAASDTALGRTFAQPDTFDFALVMKVFVEPLAPPPETPTAAPPGASGSEPGP